MEKSLMPIWENVSLNPQTNVLKQICFIGNNIKLVHGAKLNVKHVLVIKRMNVYHVLIIII